MVSLKEKNHLFPNKETHMTSIVDSSVNIHTSDTLAPCPPPWFGETVLVVTHLKKQGVLTKLSERVQFARRRFGHYEVIDFLAVQIALRDQWGAHPGDILREPPAFRGPVHGLV
jgi:hypothetical protein